MDTRQLLEKAVELAGSQAKLGKAAGVTQNAIWQAMQKGRVTPELAAGIHDATHGRVAKWQLRPDLWHEPSSAGAA